MRPPGGILAPGESIIATGNKILLCPLSLSNFQLLIGQWNCWSLTRVEFMVCIKCLTFVFFLIFLCILNLINSFQVHGAS